MARFHLWQARRWPGAPLTNAPGSWNFSDLHTPDRADAMAFYRPVFGWVGADLAPDAGRVRVAVIAAGVQVRQPGGE